MKFYVVWYIWLAVISNGVWCTVASTEQRNGGILSVLRELKGSVANVSQELKEDMEKVKEQIHQVSGDLSVQVLAVKKQVDENKKQVAENKKEMREIEQKISEFHKHHTDMVLVDAPTKIAPTLLRTVCIGRTYKVAFQVFPTSWASDSSKWSTIINFRGNDDNMNQVLVVWCKEKKIVVSTNTVNGHHGIFIRSTPNLNEWLSVEISNTLEGSNYIYTVTINGEKEVSITNTKPRRICNIKAYLASPPNAASWPVWQAQAGFVRRFTFYSEDTY